MHTRFSVSSLRRPLAVVALLVLAGCATQEQVRDIVHTSNYEMLVAADPALATTVPADADKGPKPAPDAAERLNTFLQAHPDDPVLGPALHLRQALLYLNQKQFDLADASFNDIKGAKLTTARDVALVGAWKEIRWWAEWAPAGGGAFRAEFDHAKANMTALEGYARSKDLASAPDVRDYFFEMHAWIGLKTGFATIQADGPALKKQTLENAINTWGREFTPGQLALINSPKIGADQAFSPSTRRVLRMRVLLDALADRAKQGLPPGSAPPDFDLLPELNQYYKAAFASPSPNS